MARRNDIELTLPMPPSANYMLNKSKGGSYRSREYKLFRSEVGWLARAAGVEPMPGNVAVTLCVYRKIKSGDLDNRIKPTLDALNEIAYHDDKQVVEIHAYRFDDKDNPRVEIVIKDVAVYIEDLEGIV